MKKLNLTNAMVVMFSTLTAIGCAAASDSKPASISAKAPTQAVLKSRYTGATYAEAGYSFRFLSHDVELARNNWEILFEGVPGMEDTIIMNTVVDDNSYIYDLGKRSCANIRSSNPGDRTNRPLAWLAYSEASPSHNKPLTETTIQVGHCYLTYNNDESGRVVALFRVKDHLEDQLLVIDEIEVLNVMNK